MLELLEKKSGNNLWTIIKLICFYAFLASAHSCLTFGENAYVDFFLLLVCLFLTPITCYRLTPSNMYGAFILALAIMYTMNGSPLLSAYLAQLFMLGIPLYLLLLRPEYKVDILDSFSKWYAFLLLISLFVWFSVCYLNISLPHTSYFHNYDYDDFGLIIHNYYLFSYAERLNPYVINDFIIRFNGFFLEPGHLGTITVLFLFINKFDFKKKYNVIFLVAIICSFSAAAYFLGLVSYMLFLFVQNKNQKLLKYFLFLLVLILFFTFYKSGDNLVNNLIFDKFLREEGALDGRISAQTLKTWNEFITGNDWFWGMGANADVQNSAGYKVYLIMNGFFGASLVLFGFWLVLRDSLSSYGKALFVLYIINFLQRVYWSWDAFLDPYILGISYFYNYSNYTKNEFKTFNIKS